MSAMMNHQNLDNFQIFIMGIFEPSPIFNPFLANVPILCLLKTPENQKFSNVFKGDQEGTLGRNKLINSLTINVPHHIETSQLICIANQLTSF